MHWRNDDLASRDLIYDILVKRPDTPWSSWWKSCFVGRAFSASRLRHINVHTVRHVVREETERERNVTSQSSIVATTAIKLTGKQSRLQPPQG
jgi:hypothetical protein